MNDDSSEESKKQGGPGDSNSSMNVTVTVLASVNYLSQTPGL